MRFADRPRLLWLHSHFLNWTGGHQFVFEVIKRLRPSFDIQLMTSAASPEALRRFAAIGVVLHQLNVRSTNSALFWLTLPLQLRRESARVRRIAPPCAFSAIVSSMFPMNVLAGTLGRDHVQLCWEPYALFWDNTYLRSFSPPEQAFCRLMHSLYGEWDLTATRSARRVLTLSQVNRDWINRVYGRDDAILTYEGVDGEFFCPTPSTALDGAYARHNIILHSTDFTMIKGTEYLIHALPVVKQAVPDAKLLITHTRSNPRRQWEIKRLTHLLGVSDMVDFIGHVEYELLPAYYTIASVVAQPSLHQSMSLSVKEAMACGTPVVTSLEGYEQTADGDAGLLVNPRETDALGQALVRILSDKVLARRMGRRGREIIRERFSWDTVAGRFKRALEDVA